MMAHFPLLERWFCWIVEEYPGPVVGKFPGRSKERYGKYSGSLNDASKDLVDVPQSLLFKSSEVRFDAIPEVRDRIHLTT
jgi:hypothetical protein